MRVLSVPRTTGPKTGYFLILAASFECNSHEMCVKRFVIGAFEKESDAKRWGVRFAYALTYDWNEIGTAVAGVEERLVSCEYLRPRLRTSRICTRVEPKKQGRFALAVSVRVQWASRNDRRYRVDIEGTEDPRDIGFHFSERLLEKQAA